MTLQSDEYFELIFEGLLDNSPETLRKIKGVFLTEMDMSVTEAQQVLTEIPAILKQATSEGELKPYFDALSEAGAKVLLVRPTALEESEPTEQNDEEPIELEFDMNEPTPEVDEVPSSDNTVAPVSEDDLDTIALDFELEEEDSPTETPAAETSTETEVPATTPEEPQFSFSDTLEETEGTLEEDTSPEESPGESSKVLEPSSELTFEFDSDDDDVAAEATATPAEPGKTSVPELGFGFDEEETLPDSESAPEAQPNPAEPAPDTVTASSESELSFDTPEENESEEAGEEPKPDSVQEHPGELDISGALSLDSTEDEEVTGSHEFPAAGVSLETEEGPGSEQVEEIVTGTASDDDEFGESVPLGQLQKQRVHKKKVVAESTEDVKEVGEEEFEAVEPEDDYEEEEPESDSKKRAPYDLIAAVLLGCVVLYYFNFLHGAETDQDVTISEESIKAASAAQPATKKKKNGKKKAAPPSEPVEVSGAVSAESYELKWTGTIQDGKFLAITFEGSTPETAEITREELVQGKVRTPWISRFESEIIRFTEPTPEGVRGEGKVRIYLESGGKRKQRIVAKASVEGFSGAAKENYGLRFQFWSETEEPEFLNGIKLLPPENKAGSHTVMFGVNVQEGSAGQKQGQSESSVSESSEPNSELEELQE